MMDLLSIVPYYDGHLCAALAGEDGLRVTLGAITYQHDRGYFRRQGVRNRPGLDIAARLPLPAALLRPLKALEATLNLAALAPRFVVSRPDVVHVQFLPLMELGIPIERWVLRAVRALGIKVVHTVHNVLPPATERVTTVGRHRSLYREVYEFADALICHNERAKTRLVREFGVSPERVRVIPHGPLFECLCSETREEARGRLGLEADECLVLLQGILRPYKGVSFLLKAWREVAGSGRSPRLAIVGTGKNESMRSIRDDVAALGIGSSVRLEFKFVTVEELGRWYRASDVLVYPYSEATTSGALMTGITYGKAIVATTTPAVSQLLRDGENALLVDYGDVSGLAGALRRLISDDRFRHRLAKQAQDLWATVPRWPAVARQTREYYEAVMASDGTVRTVPHGKHGDERGEFSGF
jgi:glycosyltransferase involved in cell wall biosynthesis